MEEQGGEEEKFFFLEISKGDEKCTPQRENFTQWIAGRRSGPIDLRGGLRGAIAVAPGRIMRGHGSRDVRRLGGWALVVQRIRDRSGKVRSGWHGDIQRLWSLSRAATR